MRSTALVLALLAIGLFVAACSSQPQTTGTVPAGNNAAGDASAQLQNSFENSLPPEPVAQAPPSDTLSKDLAVQ